MDDVPQGKSELLMPAVREQVEDAVRKMMEARECGSGGSVDCGQQGGRAGPHGPVAATAF